MSNILKDKLKQLTDSIANLSASIGKIGAEEAPTEITIDKGASMAEVKVEPVVVESKAEEVVVPVEVPVVAEVPVVVVEPVAVAEVVETPVVEPVVIAPIEVVAEVTPVVAEPVDEALAAKVKKQEGLKKAMCSEDLEGLELSETEVALASQFSYVDLVKFAAGLSLEVASFRTAKAEAETERVITTRVAALAEAGVLFAGEAGVAQKDEVKVLSDEAFAAYVEKTKALKSIFETGAGLDKDAVEAAKANLGKLSVEPVLEPKKKDYRLI